MTKMVVRAPNPEGIRIMHIDVQTGHPARTRFGPVRIGPGQARPVDASGRVGLAHVPRDMPKLGMHREKSCRAGPLGLNGPGRALAQTNSRTVYKYIYLT
jgi:hypothetical protein